MENTANNRSSAIIGFLLATPLAVLLLVMTYDIEPLSSFYKTFTTEADGYRINVLGRFLEIGALLLLPLGLIVNLMPVMRDVRAGNGWAAHPINLLIATALVIFVGILVISFVVDQYPCWIGIPNCD